MTSFFLSLVLHHRLNDRNEKKKILFSKALNDDSFSTDTYSYNISIKKKEEGEEEIAQINKHRNL